MSDETRKNDAMKDGAVKTATTTMTAPGPAAAGADS